MTYQTVLGALGDPTRRAILERLRRDDLPVGELASLLPVSRPAVSQHLGVLQRAGLVRYVRAGTRNVYAIDARGLGALRDYLDEFWSDALRALAGQAQADSNDKELLMSSPPVLPSIVKTIVLPLDQAQAFDLFTARMGEWWPLAGYSVDGEASRGVVLSEAGAIETLGDGSTSIWGEVLEWRPPSHVCFSWHPGRDPGPSQTQVSVSFDTVPSGTRVRLEHSGWERRDASIRENYDTGWVEVLGCLISSSRAATATPA